MLMSIHVLITIRILTLSSALEISELFFSSSVLDQPVGLIYRKVYEYRAKGLFGRNSRTQCAEVCLMFQDCHSFYVANGSCVFGLSDDVNGFDSSDVIQPADDAILLMKGNNYTYMYMYMYMQRGKH